MTHKQNAFWIAYWAQERYPQAGINTLQFAATLMLKYSAQRLQVDREEIVANEYRPEYKCSAVESLLQSSQQHSYVRPAPSPAVIEKKRLAANDRD
jgi:hypothetical protein